MMAFRFLHTADWHLGKAFGTFDADKPAVLRDARWRAVEAIAADARARHAPCVLVGGDIFDSHGLADKDLRRLLAVLAAADDVRWHLLPGNHDEDRPRGVWERIGRWDVPANVIVHRSPEPHWLDDDVVLLPAPLTSKQTARDPTSWFASFTDREGRIVVGLAHGATHDFGSSEAPSVLISPESAAAGLDYLALGDWHGTKQISERAWFSGTPEPTGYRDNDAGNVLLVTLDGPGGEPDVEPLAIAQFDWRREEVRVDLTMSVEEIIAPLARGPGEKSRTLVRLALAGDISLDRHVELHNQLEASAAAYFDLDVRARDLRARAVGETAAELFASPELSALAQGLAAAATPGEEAVHRRALELLGTFAVRAAEHQS